MAAEALCRVQTEFHLARKPTPTPTPWRTAPMLTEFVDRFDPAATQWSVASPRSVEQ
jgi:hypothetical protein